MTDWSVLNRDLDITKSKVFKRPDAAFFGPILCSQNFRWDESMSPPTAATDGENLMWHPNDFIRCRDEKKGEDVSTLMHELWHVARLHDIRRGIRCPDVWNIACDIWINRHLKSDNYYIGTDWILRPDLDHINLEEEIYDHLQKNGGGGGMKPCLHGSIAATGTVTPQQAIATVMKGIQAAKMAGQPGAIPGYMEQIVDRFLSPLIPWEQHLYKWMSDLANQEFTWARPSRRGQANNIYLPSTFEDDGRLEHLLYFQDVSGSITDKDIQRFNSELKYVWDVFQPGKMTIAQFDTRITKIDEFSEGDPYEKIRIMGRGGTSLVPVRELIIERKPTAAIIFSDMDVAPMQKLPIEIPILWIAVNATHAKVPFGKLIHLKH